MSRADTGALLAPDAWLSETLGIATFSLRAVPVGASALHSALESIGGGKAFIFAKVPTADVPRVSLLESCGFHVVDTQVTLQYREQAGPARAAEIRLAVPVDRAAVGDIAASCFRYSRFHQDPQIGSEAANRVKRQWAENCVAGSRGKEVLIASLNGAVAGFLAIALSGEAAVIDLIGVAPRTQGRGVGSALVQAFVSRWHSKAQVLRVGTQISNVPSLRLYQRCGFWFQESQYVLHAHPERP